MAIFCVDYRNGSDVTGDGTALAPYKTIEYLETQINEGAGFIAGDEVRVAGTTKGAVIATANVNVEAATLISPSVDPTTIVAVGDGLILEAEGMQFFYRVRTVSSTQIAVVGSDAPSSEKRRVFGVWNNNTAVNIYKVSNEALYVTTSNASYLDRVAINNDYGFNSDTVSVVISGGWNPANFTELTDLGQTAISLDSASTFNYLYRWGVGRTYLVGYINGFQFKNFTQYGGFNIVWNNSSIYGMPHVDNWTNSLSAYTLFYTFRLLSSETYNVTFSNIVDPGGWGIGLRQLFSTNAYVNFENITLALGSLAHGFGNYQGYANLTPNNSVTGNFTIKGGATIGRLYRTLYMERSTSANVTWDAYPNTNFRFQSYAGAAFGNAEPGSAMNTAIFELIPELYGSIQDILGPDEFTCPVNFIYNGDILTEVPKLFTGAPSNYNGNSTNTLFGFNNGAKITDTTGEIYPTGWFYYRYNTVDQLTGANCIEATCWNSNNNSVIGLDMIYLQPGQTINITAVVKAKTVPSGTAASRILGLAGLNGSVIPNYKLLFNSGQIYISGGETILNTNDWLDVTLSHTNTTSGRQPVLFGVQPCKVNGQTALIDSYSYTIS